MFWLPCEDPHAAPDHDSVFGDLKGPFTFSLGKGLKRRTSGSQVQKAVHFSSFATGCDLWGTNSLLGPGQGVGQLRHSQEPVHLLEQMCLIISSLDTRPLGALYLCFYSEETARCASSSTARLDIARK